MKNKSLIVRCPVFISGVLINSFGIALITKASLGTSPISSVPYVLSLKFPVSFGIFSFLINTVFIILQILLLRKDFRPVDFLQFAVNLIFSSFIDISMSLLSFLTPSGIPEKLLSLTAGCAILGFGICVEIAPQVLMVPGEGAVNAISRTFHLRFGNVKIGFDVTLMSTAVLLSLLFFRKLNGIGIGTVISAVLVGRFVNLFSRYIR